MKELLGGEGLSKAFESLGIDAECTYIDKDSVHGFDFEIWEVSDPDFDKLANIPDNEWKEDWGYWRYATGTSVDYEPVRDFKICGETVKARQNSYNSYKETSYPDLLTYFSDEWGVGQPRNVCALAVDMANLNSMTMGELFNKLQR